MTNYKNDQMITLALSILNKFYNSKADLFEVINRAQVSAQDPIVLLQENTAEIVVDPKIAPIVQFKSYGTDCSQLVDPDDNGVWPRAQRGPLQHRLPRQAGQNQN